ncbi:MAG: VWA domain-containing protein [Clostridiales bacterium]|jgi:uncharacterized protein YegL|nr:VWA domain-containing protein [Clostridiales bacterium]
MKDNLTELVFILDRSGSMGGLEGDTIGGYNNLIEKQKAEPGEANLTTVLFDDRYELLHDGADIKKVAPVTDKEYFVRGTTALLDAVGRTIDAVGKRLSETPEPERPANVMFVITTDGMENASKTYSLEKVRGMIEHQKEKYSWEFLFLGANIDAVATARDFGISEDRAAEYRHDSVGVDACFKSMAAPILARRQCRQISPDWKKRIEDDLKNRGADADGDADATAPKPLAKRRDATKK